MPLCTDWNIIVLFYENISLCCNVKAQHFDPPFHFSRCSVLRLHQMWAVKLDVCRGDFTHEAEHVKCIYTEVLFYSGLKIISMYNLIDMCIQLTTRWFRYICLKTSATSRGVFFSILSIIFSVLSSISIVSNSGHFLGQSIDFKPYKPMLLKA